MMSSWRSRRSTPHNIKTVQSLLHLLSQDVLWYMYQKMKSSVPSIPSLLDLLGAWIVCNLNV